jgi:DNA-binding MarR family transcriptional regulator
MKIEEEIKQSKFKNDNEKLVINLMFTGNWMYTKNTQRFKPFSISPEQYNILRILRGQHPLSVTINLLIDRMLNKMSNASRLVEKLRQKGLVERKQCETDRRAVDVVITQKGLEMLSAIDVSNDEWTKDAIKLSESDTAELNRLLDLLRN